MKERFSTLLPNVSIAVVGAKELIGILNDFRTEMGRCSNGINQPAKYANGLTMKETLSPAVIKQFNLVLVLAGR